MMREKPAISDYIIGKIMNRPLLEYKPGDHNMLVRVLKRETIFRLMPVVIQKMEISGCWEVLTGCLSHAYPKVIYQGKKEKISRLMYEEQTGINPGSKMVLHKCDNPGCINMDHLKLGTHADNHRDRNNKNRQAKGAKNGRAVLNEMQVKEILSNHKDSCAEIARNYGVDRTTISQIRHGKIWSWVNT